MPKEPWDPGKGATPDHLTKLNCWAVCTHASYKTTRTWENFNNRGTKMILLSDELWSIANNCKSFANGIKLIISNNLPYLGLSKILSCIMDLMVQKYRFGKERYIKQINIWEWQKKPQLGSNIWQKMAMSEKNQVEVHSLWLHNDKKNVIAKKGLTHF